MDWRTVSDLFEGIAKTPSPSLDEQTIKFFDDEFDDLLDDEERELLARDFPRDPSDDLTDFFQSHREHLAREKKLSGAWERYIYRNPQTYRNFIVGLLATIDSLRRRVRDEELTAGRLLVRIPNSREKSFWRGKNAKVARYFAFRYRAIGELLGEHVEFDFGKLADFYFPQADGDLAKTTSGSKDARSLKFEVTLDPGGANAKLIFHWERHTPLTPASIWFFYSSLDPLTTGSLRRSRGGSSPSISRRRLRAPLGCASSPARPDTRKAGRIRSTRIRVMCR